MCSILKDVLHGAMNSTLWITVLIVHVGCIIEAQPSKSSSSGSISQQSSQSQSEDYYASFHQDEDLDSKFQLTPSESQSAAYYRRNSLMQRGPKYITESDLPISSSISDESKISNYKEIQDDSCKDKIDGYYQNFGSDCSSYYFCAAGYQLTYVCPPGERFTGKKCDFGYKCPKKLGFKNPCESQSNGYYANKEQPGKYFYCFDNAKVIELECEVGKVYIGDKCITSSSQSGKKMETLKPLKKKVESQQNNMNINQGDGDGKNCAGQQPNGFYMNEGSQCRKYYYCINGQKTSLSCQEDFLFNGDLCVHSSRYKCPQQQEEIIVFESYLDNNNKNNSNNNRRRKISSNTNTARRESSITILKERATSTTDSDVFITTEILPKNVILATTTKSPK